MLEFHTLVTLLCHGGNSIGLTCQPWEGYLYILREVSEDRLMEVLPLGGLMVLGDLETFLLMVLVALVVLGDLVAFHVLALLLVVLVALEVYLLLVASEALVVHPLVVLAVIIP